MAPNVFSMSAISTAAVASMSARSSLSAPGANSSGRSGEIVIAEERFEEFAPGLDPELLTLIQATADMELAEVEAMFGPVAK